MRRALPWLVILAAVVAVAFLLHDAGWLEGISFGRAEREGASSYLDEEGEFTNEIPDLPPRLIGARNAKALAEAAEGSGVEPGAGGGETGAPGEGNVGQVVVTFGGRVHDAAGRSVAGVHVTTRGPSGASTTLETGPDGRFKTKLEPGRYKLLFESDDGRGALALKDYLVDGAVNLDTEFVLEETVRFAVHLLRDGRGVEAAEVALHPLLGIGGKVGRTDVLGDALFEDVVAGSYWMVATLPEGEEIRRKVDLKGDQDLKVEVPPGILVFGRIQEAEEGRPVVDARIEIAVRGPSGTWIVAEATSAEDGAYEVRIPQGRVQRFYVAADGYAPWPTRRKTRTVLKSLGTVERGSETQRDVALTEGMLVTGVVRDDQNREVAGVKLRFAPRRGPALEAESDEDGAYELLGALNDRYDVVVLTEGYFSEKALRVRVPKLPPGEAFTYDVNVQATLDVMGEVVHADGKPAAGARVWVSVRGRLIRAAHNAGRDLETFSNAAGWWHLKDLPANTGVTLRGSLGTLEALPRGVRTSALPDKPVKLKLQPTVTLKGTVMDVATRMPVPGAKVVMRPRGAPGGRTTRTLNADAEGVFAAFELIPGTWALTPSKTGYLVSSPREEALDEKEGQVEIELHLDPGLPMAGLVTDLEGRALVKATVYVYGARSDGKKVSRSGRTNRRGEFRLTGFETGLYRVVAKRQGYRNAVIRDLTGGEDRLLLQMRPR